MIIKLLLLFIFILNGFGIFGLPHTLILFPIICFANKIFIKQTPYRTALLLILLGIVLSFIPAYLYRGQSFLDTFRASSNYCYIITFFALLQLRPSLRQAEKAMVYLSLIVSGLYLIQYILLPMGILILPIESSLEATSVEAERFRIAGSGIFSLAYFYGLNRYILKNDLKYLAISCINLLPIILMGFRTMLAGIAIFSLVLLYKATEGKVGKMVKYLSVACVIGIVVLQIPAVAGRVNYMIEKQSEGNQSFSNEDYIRLIQLNYFTTEYPEGILDRILGSGLAFEKTSFGRSQDELWSRGIYWMDWGLIGLMWVLGPITVLAMIWLNIKCCRIIPHKSIYYVGIWFIYLITVSLITAEYFRAGNFVIHSIALYIAYRAYLEYNQKRVR